jgi:hypothetical protein
MQHKDFNFTQAKKTSLKILFYKHRKRRREIMTSLAFFQNSNSLCRRENETSTKK